MPRRKPPPQETPTESAEVAVAPVNAEPPRIGKDGKPSAAHWRWRLAQVTDLIASVTRGEREFPKGYNPDQVIKALAWEAKNAYGFDPKHLVDTRSEAEKQLDVLDRLGKDPDAIFDAAAETIDSFIDRLEDEMRKVDALSREYVGTTNNTAEVAEVRRKKAWLERFRRVKRLQQAARNPVPPDAWHGDAHRHRAMHVLRFMLYVGRAPGGGVFTIGLHHVKLAVSIWEAWAGIEFLIPNRDDAEDEMKVIDRKWDAGVLCVIPPGHGKTCLASHFCAMTIAQDPSMRWLFGHAIDVMAHQNCQYVSGMFDREQPAGRRCLALYPGIEVEQSTKETLRLKQKDRQRAPTIRAHGIGAKISGGDADAIWFDDPVDQATADQPTERDRTFQRMNGTWRPRMRRRITGKAGGRTDPFEITTTTLWHHDDANCRRIELAKGHKIKLRSRIMACGGTAESFKPLWDKMYPASRLRSIYAQMRNPRLYAAAYQSNPHPDELRKIKRLALYDPKDAQHAEFIRTCVLHLSADPAATNTEKSDRAGLIYAGVGDIVTDRDGVIERVGRMRIIDAKEIKANPVELVHELVAFALDPRTPVHYMHVEYRGVTAVALTLEERGYDVIKHDPGIKDKEQRLNDVAPMIDASLVDRGLAAPAIEFPGVWEGGNLKIHPDLAWLADQILNFGVAVADHAVDALSQLAKHVAPSLDVGAAPFSERAKQEQVERGDPRLRRMYEEVERADSDNKDQDRIDRQLMGRFVEPL